MHQRPQPPRPELGDTLARIGRTAGLIVGYLLIALTAVLVASLGIAAISIVWGWIL